MTTTTRAAEVWHNQVREYCERSKHDNAAICEAVDGCRHIAGVLRHGEGHAERLNSIVEMMYNLHLIQAGNSVREAADAVDTVIAELDDHFQKI